MNSKILTLIPLTGAALLSTPLAAGVSAANGPDWTALDASLAALPREGASTAPSMGAVVRSSLDFSSDDGYVIGADSEDRQGVRFQDAMLWATGTIGDFTWRMNFDFANSNGQPANVAGDGIIAPTLEDAYAQWTCPESHVRITLGQYKRPPLRSSTSARHAMLFIDRTVLGQSFSFWSPGVSIDGKFDAFNWKVSLQNGDDLAAEDFALTARAEYLINGGVGRIEGAMSGADSGTKGTIGAAYFDEGDLEDGGMLALDATVVFGQFSVAAEIADLDDDLGPAKFAVTEGNTPWAVTGSWLTPSREWEVALRLQDHDDDDDTQVVSGGLNWYHGGHTAKWQLNVSDYSSDVSADEGTLIQIGLTVGSDS